jgi:hypothetical protein
MIDLLDPARVPVVIFAPHTTQIVQLLDLIPFEIFKYEAKYYLPFGDLDTTINFAYTVYMKMEKIVSLPSIWVAFQAIGVEWSLTQESFHIVLCCLSPGKIERV